VENLKGRDLLGYLGLGGRVILKWILKEIGCEDVNWIHLVPDSIRWWAFVNIVMNLWVS